MRKKTYPKGKPDGFRKIKDWADMYQEEPGNIFTPVAEDSTLILISEEYGFQEWIWEFPGNREELQEYWDEWFDSKSSRNGCGAMDCSIPSLRGIVRPLTKKEQREMNQFDQKKLKMKSFGQLPPGIEAYAHIFWKDDTFLKIPQYFGEF